MDGEGTWPSKESPSGGGQMAVGGPGDRASRVPCCLPVSSPLCTVSPHTLLLFLTVNPSLALKV